MSNNKYIPPAQQNNIKQYSIEYLCYLMFKNNISVNFILNMIINIVLSSVLIPTLFKYSNDKFISNLNINSGMQNIYKYARENNILIFVICHNPDVNKLSEYDQVINVVNGIAKIINENLIC